MKLIPKTKTIQVHIEKINPYSFEGYIFLQDLTYSELLTLGMRRLYEHPLTKIKIEGHFEIEWDDDIAMPQIDTITAIGVQDGTMYGCLGMERVLGYSMVDPITIYKPKYGEMPTYKTLDLNPEVCDLEALETQIYEAGDYGYWQADRQGSLIDAAMARFED